MNKNKEEKCCQGETMEKDVKNIQREVIDVFREAFSYAEDGGHEDPVDFAARISSVFKECEGDDELRKAFERILRYAYEERVDFPEKYIEDAIEKIRTFF